MERPQWSNPACEGVASKDVAAWFQQVLVVLGGIGVLVVNRLVQECLIANCFVRNSGTKGTLVLIPQIESTDAFNGERVRISLSCQLLPPKVDTNEVGVILP